MGRGARHFILSIFAPRTRALVERARAVEPKPPKPSWAEELVGRSFGAGPSDIPGGR